MIMLRSLQLHGVTIVIDDLIAQGSPEIEALTPEISMKPSPGSCIAANPQILFMILHILGVIEDPSFKELTFYAGTIQVVP
ncbi:hypothetical protein [Celeribacter halophilus]|uniref:hypothetical protein n=1 Tax=Celeribacter halophilus TaxID=576117 RepID=UPI003A95AB07